PLLMVGRLLSATGAVLLMVLVTKMIADWFAGHEIIWAMTIVINAWPVGIGAASFTLPIVARVWGMPAVFLVAAGAAAAGAMAVAWLYRSPPPAAAEPESMRLAVLSRRETALVSVAALPWMSYNIGFAVMLGFVPSLLVRRGLSVEQAGWLLGLSTILIIGSVQLGGACAQWLVAPPLVVTVGLLSYAGALLALPSPPPSPPPVPIGPLGGPPPGAPAHG